MLVNTVSSSSCQISDVQVQVSQNTEALQGAQMEIGDLTRQIQTLEIELASQQSLVSMDFMFYCFVLVRTNPSNPLNTLNIKLHPLSSVIVCFCKVANMS